MNAGGSCAMSPMSMSSMGGGMNPALSMFDQHKAGMQFPGLAQRRKRRVLFSQAQVRITYSLYLHLFTVHIRSRWNCKLYLYVCVCVCCARNYCLSSCLDLYVCLLPNCLYLCPHVRIWMKLGVYVGS